MGKNSPTQPGILKPRVLLAAALCLSGIFTALIGLAATPPNLGVNPLSGQHFDSVFTGKQFRRSSVNSAAQPTSVWSIVSSPNDDTDRWNFLHDVTCLSEWDCWAVGSHLNSAGFYQSLVEHWDGAAWSIIPSQDSSAQNSYLWSVTCPAENDCWAVGDYSNGTAMQTQIEHWDGVSWMIVASPNVNTQNNYLSSVSCVAGNECWSVGYYDNGSDHQTLIERWDGNSWSIIPSPNSSQKSRLFGVTCISETDCWAAGGDLLGSALTEHWDGVSWSIVESPSLNSSWLAEISCLSSSQCWAVGRSYTGYGDPLTLTSSQTFIEQWDGNAWSIVPSPNRGDWYNDLAGVACLSASDCWAVGAWQSSGPGNGALLLHWDGNFWSIADSPSNPYGAVTILSVLLACHRGAGLSVNTLTT